MAYTNQNINEKNVKYLNKSFSDFKANLIDFSKIYFPNSYNDFNESSPGMMMIELSAYVGDVLSYYLDYQFKENLIQHASEKGNVYKLAESLGYDASLGAAAVVDLDIFHLVPSIGEGASIGPDLKYALNIKPGMQAKSTNGSFFNCDENISFGQSGSAQVSVHSVDSSGNPNFYLMKKTATFTSGRVLTKDFVVGSPSPNFKILLPSDNIIDVRKIIDSDGGIWTKVPYLANETIFSERRLTPAVDPSVSSQNDKSPYLLTVKRTPKRFTTRITSTGRVEIQFGSGISSRPDEEIIPNPENVGSNLPGSTNNLDRSFDPANFMFSKVYGEAPGNTTLTVEYVVGKGLEDNVPSNTINQISTIEYDIDDQDLDQGLLNTVKGTIAINNLLPATGGKTSDSIDSIKNEALASYATQNRAVTKQDYIVRTYAMPGRFGSIAKAYVDEDTQIVGNENQPNPLALNLHILTYDSNRQLVQVNNATKNNLRTYLSQFRMLTDAINIKDAFVINIGVEFEIVALPNYSAKETLLKCIERLKGFFHIDKWQIGQPIVKRDVIQTLALTEGVQSVVGQLRITNKYRPSQGYSGNIYNIKEATLDDVVYPSFDPSIFEVKYPDTDIIGKVSSY